MISFRKALKYIGGKSITAVLSCPVDSLAIKNKGFNLLDNNQAKIKTYSFRNEQKEMKEWLKNKSKCFSVYGGEVLSGYGWLHVINYRYLNGKKVCFSSCCSWFGPDYIFPDYRGKALHSELIEQRLHYLDCNNYKYAITAINIKNTSSLNNFKRNGFVIVFRVITRRILFFNFTKTEIVNRKLYDELEFYV